MAPAKLQPALLGGVTIGVLSALPVINLANCCCAWILFGGALSAYLMQQGHPEPINAAMAPFQSEMANRMMRDAADMAPELRGILENMSTAPAIGIGLIFFFFVMLVVSSLFGMIGGLFGALMFRKSQPPVVPPPIPPQSF